jgi:hypothetical protein
VPSNRYRAGWPIPSLPVVLGGGSCPLCARPSDRAEATIRKILSELLVVDASYDGQGAGPTTRSMSILSNLSGCRQLPPEGVYCLEPLGKKVPFGSRQGPQRESRPAAACRPFLRPEPIWAGISWPGAEVLVDSRGCAQHFRGRGSGLPS